MLAKNEGSRFTINSCDQLCREAHATSAHRQDELEIMASETYEMLAKSPEQHELIVVRAGADSVTTFATLGLHDVQTASHRTYLRDTQAYSSRRASERFMNFTYVGPDS